ncbi:MAG TPA: helix-turn-helix domain-containing protein [Pseudonocardiaceae bacterium]
MVSDVLYAADGPILTSAGACVELCLHLISTDHGTAAANAAARLAVVAPPRPAEATQTIQTPLPTNKNASVANTREWALRKLDQPITLTDLATHAGVSVRTLTRRFQAETGQSPLRWLLHRRLDRARQLLETTSLPMDQVAWHSGMGTADSLRQHTLSKLGATPRSIRDRHRQRHEPVQAEQ